MKRLLIFGILAVVTASAALFYIHYKYPAAFSKTPPPAAINNNFLPSLSLPVPFTPQAPTANWDELHNEACEEASSIMAAEYFKGNTDKVLDPALVETQLTILTAWEDKNLGYHLDTTSAETAEMIEQVYGLKTKLIKNFTAEQLKTGLTQKHLVIISEYGRDLHNPNYRSPGPTHHMLLVRGYSGNTFYTNDPGTKNGLNYPYPFNTLYEAATDWNQKTDTVDHTQKVAMIVWQ